MPAKASVAALSESEADAVGHRAQRGQETLAHLVARGEGQRLIATIKDMRAAGTTIVWIEHIVHALLAVVDRLVVLNFGRKIAEGEPREVMRSPGVGEIYMGLAQ